MCFTWLTSTSSSVNQTTRIVLLGLNPISFNMRILSNATIQPWPSSCAPWPTSHESIWAPITTISFGFSRPINSAMILRLVASGWVTQDKRKWPIIYIGNIYDTDITYYRIHWLAYTIYPHTPYPVLILIILHTSFPFPANRAINSAFSSVIAAAGISARDMVPVCGVFKEKGVTLRIKTALAPVKRKETSYECRYEQWRHINHDHSINTLHM